jgi:ketosteroid isomerase-like protein
MSEENVEIVRRSVEAHQRGDLDAAFAEFDAEIEWVETESLGPDAAVYRGTANARLAVEAWLGMWAEYESMTEQIIDAGNEVVVLMTERGRGKGSGVEVERELAGVHTLRDGKIVRTRLFGSWDQALEAVGLSE